MCRGVTVLFLVCVNVVECELWQGIEEKYHFCEKWCVCSCINRSVMGDVAGMTIQS